MHRKKIATACIAALYLSVTGCSTSTAPEQQTNQSASQKTNELSVAYEQFTLDNGLKVILHQDKSDPIVAMATVVHVGSNREKPGRTGFAHFFEHMSFNDSENVPKGANRKMIPELGGSRNGGTWSDGTIYYEVVPKDAFDKLLWIDSDRLGYMINTVDAGTLEREKQVVKNEKRQRVDNRPYGHTGHVIRKALYPTSHPYNWTVIGDLEDLQAATLYDVREFYDTFYTPSNATLVIAGDIDFASTKKKVEQWFGEIKAGEPAAPLKPQAVTLTESKKLYHEDNFARLPELRLTFPTPEQYTKDAYALDVLGRILSDGKSAPLYQTIVSEQKLAPRASAYNNANELSGTFTISVRAKADVKLDDVYGAIQTALTDFEQNGVDANQLQRIKAELETDFYYGIESILDKALQLGIYNEYAGSPSFIQEDIANIKAVTADDVVRVYERYIKNKPAIFTSFVPRGKTDLVLADSVKANVVEEKIKPASEPDFVENDDIRFVKTPTQFDRSEPPLTDLPALTVPSVWDYTTPNNINVVGIEYNELPIVKFSMTIKGGQLLDPQDKTGVARLMASLMNEGTALKTPEQLEQAIGLLGAGIRISSSQENITIQGQTLARNFNETIALVSEMLLKPRWDEAEFERLKSAQLTGIQQEAGVASRIAYKAFMKTLYGSDNPLALPLGGTAQSVGAITLDDVKAFYANNISPSMASFHVVGDVTEQDVVKALSTLNEWKGDKVALPSLPEVASREKPEVYFIDLPGAKQSVIYVGKPAVAGSDPDFYSVVFANKRLGEGMSARLGQTLRIQKGYTYGAYSYIPDNSYVPPFIASSQVRSNVTLESLEIFKDLIGNYQATYGQEDLETARNMTIKANSRRFETTSQQLRMLENITRNNLAKDYIDAEQTFVQNVDLESVHQTINQYLDEQQMIYVIVGDGETQLSRIESLGYGKPVVLDLNGDPQ